MSKPRLKLRAVIDTEPHADMIISSIRNKLIGKDIFEEHSLKRFKNEEDKTELSLDFRFNSQVDRDDVKDWMKDQVHNHPQIKNWVLLAKVVEHLCSHDSSTVLDCRTTEYVEWTR